MIRIFIGYDPRETVAFHVLSHSIQARASTPVSVTPLMLDQLDRLMWRDRHNLQSTDFSFSRFLVPHLCGYEGWALFMDCDMLVLDDVDAFGGTFVPAPDDGDGDGFACTTALATAPFPPVPFPGSV